jgi:sulfite reductase alpha subunit-like flavoprotein
VKFAVWACGSSAFRRSFAGFGKDVEKKLKELGAEEVTTLGIRDDQDEQSTDLDTWIKGLGVPGAH